jgi:hypothetical protein
MATAAILQLKQAIGATGAEQLEAVQAGASVRMTSAQIAALAAQLIPTGATALIEGVPLPGANNDYTVNGQMGPAVGFIDLTPTAPCTITGLQAGTDGQIVTLTNLTGIAATFEPLNNGSAPANQFRMANSVTLAQYDSQSFRYSTSIGMWITMSPTTGGSQPSVVQGTQSGQILGTQSGQELGTQ